MGKRMSLPFLTLVGAMLLFLLAPILLLLPLSLSADPFMNFPPNEWGLRWYRALLEDGAMFAAFRTSVILGLLVTALSIVVALPAAYAIVKIPSRTMTVLYNLFTAPLLLPSIVLGLAILIVFAANGLFGTFQGLVVAHLIVVLPVTLRIIATALKGVPPAIEEAAATLGAGPWRVFMLVSLPQIRPALAVAAALGFLSSFDEAVISLFVAGPNIVTLPVALFHHIERQADPLVACVSVVLVCMTLLIVLLVARTRGLARTFGS